jgi:hypothetical protein
MNCRVPLRLTRFFPHGLVGLPQVVQGLSAVAGFISFSPTSYLTLLKMIAR